MKLFKKRKNILAVILTTSNVKKLKRAYQSLKNAPKTCSIDIEIMINTLDTTYPQQVYEAFKHEKAKITESPSNGTAGKGKNCVLEHFRNHKNNYDYLMMIDGDDFFYPTAFECFEKILVHYPDVIGLQASDVLLPRDKTPDSEFYHWIQDNVHLNSWNEKEKNLCIEFPRDLNKPVYQQHSPDRVLFMSERLLKTEKDLFCDDNVIMYCDFAFSISLFQKAINKHYSYVHFSNSYAYVYDLFSENSISKNAKKKENHQQLIEESFKKSIQNDLKKCEYNIDFRIIPFFKLGPPPSGLSNQDKIDFLRENIIL